MAQKPVLGKGLASLFPSASMGGAGVAATPPPLTPPETPSRERHLGISMASIDEIHANQFQPRRDFDDATLAELAQSIRSSGIIQPLVVRKSTVDGFELIAGERRLRAAKLAGLKHVPIVIRKSTDRETLELALIENIQRQNLNCIDEALAYFQLIQDFSLTQEEVSERVGKDRATVSNYLRLLRLPEVIINDLKAQILTFGHGKALLGLEDVEMRLKARAEILRERLSVRESEALVEAMKANQTQPTSVDSAALGKSPVANRLSHLSHELARTWSTKVEIKGSEKHGKIVIHYSTRQDLDRILERMQTENI